MKKDVHVGQAMFMCESRALEKTALFFRIIQGKRTLPKVEEREKES